MIYSSFLIQIKVLEILIKKLNEKGQTISLMSIKTLIVGLGKVGMMYDYNNKISNYTHAQSE